MQLSAQNLVFLSGSFIAPAVLVMLNFVVRRTRKWYYTAGSDFLFTEMTFSFASAILWKDMSNYIHNPYIRDISWVVFIMLGLFILLCWFWTVSRVESAINDAIRRRVAATSLPQGKIFVSWGFAVGFFALEVMTFVYS